MSQTQQPTVEFLTRLSQYIEQQQHLYITFINEENYKKAYQIAKKLCIVLQQSVKQLCLKLANQLTYISDMKEMVILILDDHRQFSNIEIQQLFEFKFKLKKDEDFLDQEGKKLLEYLQDHLFFLISFVNNIGVIEILRKNIDVGLNCLCRGLFIRQFLLTHYLYVFQYVQLQLNICVVLKLKQQYSQAISLMTFPMNHLEQMVQKQQAHNFLIKNKTMFSLMEYFVNNKQKAQIPFPREIPPIQFIYHLLLGYSFYSILFGAIEKKQAEAECRQYFAKLYEDYKKMHPHGFKQMNQQNANNKLTFQSPRTSQNQPTSSKRSSQQQNDEKPQEKDNIKETVDESIVFYQQVDDNKYSVAMNLREDKDCIEIIIYSLQYEFTRKLYISLLDLDDYRNPQSYQDLFAAIEVVDLENGQFDISNHRWYETMASCMQRLH